MYAKILLILRLMFFFSLSIVEGLGCALKKMASLVPIFFKDDEGQTWLADRVKALF